MNSWISDPANERMQDTEFRQEYGAENIKYEIAKAVQKARNRQQLTQSALAERVGVTQAYISKLESGEANPTIGHVGAILATIWVKPDVQIRPLVTVRSRMDFGAWEGAKPSAVEDTVINYLQAGNAGTTEVSNVSGYMVSASR